MIRPRKIEYSSPRQSIIPTNEARPFCISPTPYSKPSVGNLLQKFSEGNVLDKESKPIIYKKRTAPRPPIVNTSEEKTMWTNKKNHAPQRPKSPVKPNPIKEMESIGKKLSDDV